MMKHHTSRMGRTGAAVLLAASMSISTAPVVSAADASSARDVLTTKTQHPSQSQQPNDAITVPRQEPFTYTFNSTELKTALRLNTITVNVNNVGEHFTTFTTEFSEMGEDGKPSGEPILTTWSTAPFSDDTASATQYIPGSMVDPAKKYVVNVILSDDHGNKTEHLQPLSVVTDSAAPTLTVNSARLNTMGETVLKVHGTGYTGEGAAQGVSVVVTDTDIWAPGRRPRPSIQFIARVDVSPEQIHNGAFEAEVKIPAEVAATLHSENQYILATLAGGDQGPNYRSLDAQQALELYASEPTVTAIPTDAPTVAPLPEATVGVNPTDAPTVPALPEATVVPEPQKTESQKPADKAPAGKVPAAEQAPVADKTPNADKLEDATVAHPKSKPAQENPVSSTRSTEDSLAKETSTKKSSLANTGASGVGVIVVLGVVAICAGLGLSVLRSRRRS